MFPDPRNLPPHKQITPGQDYTAPQPGDPDLTEEERVVAWRFECLSKYYPLTDAERLAADLDVDLHLAIKTRESGCDLKTALAILL